MISNYFIVSGIASIGSIVGVSIWSNSTFTLTSIYEFYWFVSITSLIFSIVGYLLHTFHFILEVIGSQNLIYIHLASILLFGVLYTLFWLSSAITLSQVVRQCSLVKNVFDFNCDGEIVSMVFAYINFAIWGLILYKGTCVWLDRYIHNLLPNNIPLNDLETQNQQDTTQNQQDTIQNQQDTTQNQQDTTQNQEAVTQNQQDTQNETKVEERQDEVLSRENE